MYKSKEFKKILVDKFAWKDYGDKHEESTLTKWFQSYWLFQIQGIDKRKAHFSSLINAGQMTRAEAMWLLTAKPVYPVLHIENRVMKYPKHRHEDFAIDRWFDRISKFIRLWKS